MVWWLVVKLLKLLDHWIEYMTRDEPFRVLGWVLVILLDIAVVAGLVGLAMEMAVHPLEEVM